MSTQSEPNDASELLQRITKVLAEERGKYVTLQTLSVKTGLDASSIKDAASRNASVVRKSKIAAPNSEPLYTLNTPLSGVADMLKAVSAVNRAKY